MKKKPKNSLENYSLSKYQKIWIDYVYPHNGSITEAETVRQLKGKIPTEFKIFEEMHYFWDNNRLTIFGLYKANKKDETIVTLDLMLKVLRDKFVLESGRNAVTLSEFVSEIQGRKSTLDKIFRLAYFYDFWIDANLQERISADEKTAEPKYEFGGSGGIQHVMGYKGLESQIECKWLSRVGARPVASADAELALGWMGPNGTGYGVGLDRAQENVGKGNGRSTKAKLEMISVSSDGLLATWKGRTVPVNEEQADILRACIAIWVDRGKKPLTIRIEQVRRWAGNDDLGTVGRAFNKHALARLFKVVREKGAFEFKP